MLRAPRGQTIPAADLGVDLVRGTPKGSQPAKPEVSQVSATSDALPRPANAVTVP
jgi:hypothetical protein